MVWCGVVWCRVVCCGVVWCGVVCCGVVWCGVVCCGVVCAVLVVRISGADPLVQFAALSSTLSRLSLLRVVQLHRQSVWSGVYPPNARGDSASSERRACVSRAVGDEGLLPRVPAGLRGRALLGVDAMFAGVWWAGPRVPLPSGAEGEPVGRCRVPGAA